jgi:hypothetical protein
MPRFSDDPFRARGGRGSRASFTMGSAEPQPPTGFTFLTDADGALLTDVDGAYLMETL